MKFPRFQIHLSTAVVLMFAAGVIIWANCLYVPSVGWPILFNKVETVCETRCTGNSISIVCGTRTSGFAWGLPRLLFDLAIAISILCMIGLLCEWRIRRSEARKDV